ncbi:MAG: Eco57I restriction-modification methylase domain-containing protein, partial [Chloroflexota bacterium]
MSQPLQLSLGVQDAVNNQYLFSDHYLLNLLPRDPRWGAALAEAEAFLAWVQALYAQEQDHLDDYNETQLEDHWIRPILQRLGHVWEGQASVPGLGEGVKRPDYVFFPDEGARAAAVGAQNTAAYVAEALAVGEAKAWQRSLDKKARGGGPSFDRQNPGYQIDYYLRATELEWGILSNGRLWRLVHRDSSQRLTIYYEVDLVELLRGGNAGTMRYFTLFFRQDALRPDAQGRRFLQDALDASNAYAVALEEDMQENVYRALELLMQGFLDLRANDLGPDDLRRVYDNSLYLLYRFLFILYAESRGLLPLDREDYREHYSLHDIKNDIANHNAPTAPSTTDFWKRVQTLFQIINGDDEELNRFLGVPRYNGGLFNPRLHPFLQEKAVGDAYLTGAIDLLSRRDTEQGKEFADYRTLGVRQLGSIYEGLLEYQPRLAQEEMVAVKDGGQERWLPASEKPDGATVTARRKAGQVYLVTDRGERKATGSYYTPEYIVRYIVEQTVGPLVEEARGGITDDGPQTTDGGQRSAVGGQQSADGGQAFVDAILSLRVLDPAMGSGHFLVYATDYLALALATEPQVEPPATAEDDVVYWKRRVVERCIYGVDRNPLAVELAKLSLWLNTVAADRPLSFLDHHLKCGDSLVGAEVEDLGWAPPTVLTRKQARELEKVKEAGQMNLLAYRLAQQLPAVMGRVLEITEAESDSYESVQAKEAADRTVRQLKEPFEAVADLWVSAYFGNEFDRATYEEARDAVGTPAALMQMPAVQRARQMAQERRFFHWELAFPEVFYDEAGNELGERAGFDAVVGNPPYFSVDDVWGKRSLAARFLKERYYEIWAGKSDIFYYFIKQGLSLVRQNGFLSFITARYFLESYYAEKLRAYILENARIQRILDFGNNVVFPEVGTKVCVTILQRSSIEDRPTDDILFARLDDTLKDVEIEQLLQSSHARSGLFSSIPQSMVESSIWNLSAWFNKRITDRVDRDCIP